MLKKLIKKVAYQIVKSDVEQNWINRDSLYRYTRIMKDDFEVFQYLEDYFKNDCYGSKQATFRHRDEAIAHLKELNIRGINVPKFEVISADKALRYYSVSSQSCINLGDICIVIDEPIKDWIKKLLNYSKLL